MSFGTLVKDSQSTPISQGYIPGSGFAALQSSLVKNQDASLNTSTAIVISNAIHEAIMNGMAYSVLENQTVGPSGGGQYAVSVYNPGSKNVFIYSIKCMANYSNTTAWLYLKTSNPSYNTTLTPANLQAGGSGSSLASGSVTANSSSISFPTGTNFDMTIGQPEALTNNTGILLPNGSTNAIIALVSISNSQEYAITVKWIEF